MARRKSDWLSPTKQRLLMEELRKERKKKIITHIILGVVVLVALGLIIMGAIMASRPYYADIEIEGYGTITIKLNDDEAPITVEQFVSLAEDGFYDGTTIPRVLKDDMLCGGFKASGEAPSSIKGEFSKNGVENNISHTRGVISMLRKSPTDGGYGDEEANYYDTATNEFFIMQRDNLELDTYYAGFGIVVDGMDIVDEICNNVESQDGLVAEENRPVIKTITIRRSK